MKTLVKFVVSNTRLVSILVVASLAISGYSASQIESRFQFKDFYDYPGNSRLPDYHAYHGDFGDAAGYVALLIESDAVFTPDVLHYIQSVTQTLERESVFLRVRSLTNTNIIRGESDEVVTGPLIGSVIPTDPIKLNALRATALNSPLAVRRLLSADAQVTAVLAEMRTPAEFSTIPEQASAINAVQAAVSKLQAPAGVKTRITGGPVVEVETTSALLADQKRVMPVVLGLLLLALFATFRSVSGVLMPVGAVVVATVWTLGVFALLGRPLDMIGSVIPTTLLVYGVVDPVFVLTRYLGKLKLGKSKHDAIVESMMELGLPCFLTSFTTSLAFGSFLTAGLPTIRYYGITVAIGVMFAWVTTVLVLPLLLAVFPPPKVNVTNAGLGRWLDGVLGGYWRVLSRNLARVIVLTVGLLAILSLYGSKQQISNEYVGGLPKGSAYDDVRFMESKMSGVMRAVVYLRGAPDDMKRPEVLRAIAAVDRYAEAQPLTTTSSSLADLVAEANRAFQGGGAEALRIPESRNLISQYLSLIDPVDRGDFVTQDYSRAHIAVLTRDEGSEVFRRFQEGLENEMQRQFKPLGIDATLTGNAVVGYTEMDQIVIELLWGFVLAFGVIVVVQWIMFRSLRIALLSIVPNLLPVLACFGVIRALGMSLRADNSLMLCICIGGLFNTTIHIVARMLQRIAAGDRDPDAILDHAVRLVGPPSLYAAAILSMGFSALVFSQFPGLRTLGVLSMVTFLLGFFSDVTFTTTSLRAFFGWKKAVGRTVERVSAEGALAGIAMTQEVSNE